ncbi:unnamed protein product [Arabidopsis arenosa]|uniref:Brf1 TBP-binding domain-containing protein n=1 Tax=Arabidopsis arenosa TaxID=38785 RepID=A0A8S2B3C3_ARAAE|nr:unnamed protein product [Arabidopsis arenosa]
MVEKSVKLSSKGITPVDIISQALLSSKSLARNRKVCGNKGVFPCRQSKGDLAEDLSDISDAEVADNLNNKKEFILKKRAWELMNPEYQKGSYRKVTTGKKKDPANKTAPSKKTSATRTESNAGSENKKKPSLEINYDVLDKLFDPENSPKRAKLDKPVVVGDQMEYSKQSSEESLLKPQYSEKEEEEEPDWNEDYSNEDAYKGNEECYGDEDLEFEDQDEEEDNEGVIW